jgi:hypothetical protein
MKTHRQRLFSGRVGRVALALPATAILWGIAVLTHCSCKADVVDSDVRGPETALAKPATDAPADVTAFVRASLARPIDAAAKLWNSGSGSHYLSEAVVGRAAFERPLLMRDLSVSPLHFLGAADEAADSASQRPLDAGFHEQEALRAMKVLPIPEAAGQGLVCLLFVIGVGLGWRHRRV